MNHLSYKHVKVHKGKVYVFETLRDFNVWKTGWFFSKNSRVYDAVPGVYILRISGNNGKHISENFIPIRIR